MKPWRTYEHRKIDSNTIICLDIEVTSFWVHNGKIIGWDKNKSDDFYNKECEKGSCVYIWMVGIEDEVYYGREWNEFPEFLSLIKEDATLKNPEKDKIYIYVHNFAYEFQFLINFGWEWDNIFARQKRKPMKADFDIFQFRCSYMLTNLSLDSWGKQLGVYKLHDLDYTCVRSPKTPLFDYELEYCEADILVMLSGLKKFRTKYKKLKSVPLTATGEVRKVVRKMYAKNIGYLKKVTSQLPKTTEEYKISKAVFGGGDTHANAYNVGIVRGAGECKDECSAYPFYMCVGSFPTSCFTETIERENFNTDRFCYIFFIHMHNVKSKYKITYLASSRCISVINGVYDNGRVSSADDIYLYCTEYDLEYIKYMYDAKIEYLSVRKAIKGHLNKQYVNYILDLFNDKTTLKGVSGYEDLYMQQKAYLNSLY